VAEPIIGTSTIYVLGDGGASELGISSVLIDEGGVK